MYNITVHVTATPLVEILAGSLEQSLEKMKANPPEKRSTAEPSAEPAPAPAEASVVATAPTSCETLEVPGLENASTSE